MCDSPNLPPVQVSHFHELHELNNALTVVFGYSEVLLSSILPDDPNRAIVEAVHNAAQRAAHLSRDMLDRR